MFEEIHKEIALLLTGTVVCFFAGANAVSVPFRRRFGTDALMALDALDAFGVLNAPAS